jgi:uncharacterized iron-regulated membrane protein
MMKKINLIALVAGISTLLLIVVSIFVPWWQFTAMNPANVQVNFSPVNLNLTVSGSTVAIPLVIALNIACLLILLAGGLTLLIYSVKPTQPYSKRLLGFGYKQSLIVLVIFIIEIVSIPLILQAVGGFNLPINGASTIIIPQKFSSAGSSTSLNVSAVFNLPFYFAIVVVGLSIAARVYHRKIVSSAALPPAVSSTTN